MSENREVVNVVKLFKESWVDSVVNHWYSGKAPSVVMNNNGLESTNRRLKDEITHYELLPMVTFIQRLHQWLKSESQCRNPSSSTPKLYATVPLVTKSLFTLTQKWIKDIDH